MEHPLPNPRTEPSRNLTRNPLSIADLIARRADLIAQLEGNPRLSQIIAQIKEEMARADLNAQIKEEYAQIIARLEGGRA